MWAYLLKRRQALTSVISTSSGGMTTTAYGSFGQFAPEPDPPNGTATTFDLPNSIGYISGTIQVYLNGILQLSGTHYAESNPSAGEFTFNSPPEPDDQVWVVCRTTGS
jgi:hypothetical protein